MNDMPTPTRSEFSKDSLPVKKPLVEVLAIDPADLKNGPSSERPWRGKRVPRALTRFLITFCIGITATWAWLSYGDAARETIASSFPQLGWLAPQAASVGRNIPNTIAPPALAAPSPDQQKFDAMSLDLDTVWQRVDRLTASQEQMARNVDQLTASQARMTREITKLQEIVQYIIYKSSEPPPRQASAAVATPRSSQARTAR